LKPISLWLMIRIRGLNISRCFWFERWS